MAARFLASAFCSGPAILLLLVLLVRRLTGFDPGKKAINRLAVIIAYAMGRVTTVSPRRSKKSSGEKDRSRRPPRSRRQE